MIKIICIGKLKEKFYQEAVQEYCKRLSKYTKLEIIEIPDFKSDSPIIEREKEKEKIWTKIEEKDYVITLDIEGKQLDSIEFADQLESLMIKNPRIVFVIGGSSGLHEDIKKRSNFSLSFSRLTFPHQLFRVILLEQIYRGFKIIHKETYHK